MTLRRDNPDLVRAANDATYQAMVAAGIAPGAARLIKSGRPYAGGDAVVGARWVSPARLDLLTELGRKLGFETAAEAVRKRYSDEIRTAREDDSLDAGERTVLIQDLRGDAAREIEQLRERWGFV